MGFRKDFVWGAATAAFQIEGAALRTEKAEAYGMNFRTERARFFRTTTEISPVITITDIKMM